MTIPNLNTHISYTGVGGGSLVSLQTFEIQITGLNVTLDTAISAVTIANTIIHVQESDQPGSAIDSRTRFCNFQLTSTTNLRATRDPGTSNAGSMLYLVTIAEYEAGTFASNQFIVGTALQQLNQDVVITSVNTTKAFGFAHGYLGQHGGNGVNTRNPGLIVFDATTARFRYNLGAAPANLELRGQIVEYP